MPKKIEIESRTGLDRKLEVEREFFSICLGYLATEFNKQANLQGLPFDLYYRRPGWVRFALDKVLHHDSNIRARSVYIHDCGVDCQWKLGVLQDGSVKDFRVEFFDGKEIVEIEPHDKPTFFIMSSKDTNYYLSAIQKNMDDKLLLQEIF